MNNLCVLAALAALFQAALAGQQGAKFESATLTPSHGDSRNYSGKIEPLPGVGEARALRLTMRNVTLLYCIQQAYSLKEYQISGPSSMRNARYDIDATLPAGVAPDQVWPALQALLTERLKLTVRREQKQMAVFRLTVGPTGPKLHPANGVPAIALRFQPAGRGARAALGGNGSKDLRFNHASLEELCSYLSASTNRPVIDSTGIAGTFDFEFHFQAGGDKSGHSTSAALQRQFGLRLEPDEGTLDVLIVEGVLRKPSNP
jgi:uncharacterized protein (TIGR03435 family)